MQSARGGGGDYLSQGVSCWLQSWSKYPGPSLRALSLLMRCRSSQFNFNEAVNFALPDWLPQGLECVKRYQEHRKLPVFSHDELIITITQQSTSIKTAIW